MRGGRRRKIGDAQVARWVVLYGDGLTARAIAAREGVGFGAVLEYLRRAGVRMRTPGRRRRWAPGALAELAQRLGVRGAAATSGCSVWTVYVARQTAGGSMC